MSRALQLAKHGLYTTDPNPRVGCVLVKDNIVIAEGWHQLAGEPHAEINALDQAGERARGADCYVTLEPCSHTGKTPPCTDELIKSGIKRLFAATIDPNPDVAGNGLKILQDSGIKTEAGLMQDQSQALNPGFESRMRKGRPYIRCKLAMSVDGRTALASGESRWISSVESRQDVQRLRARSSAIMTGVNTVIADDPSLNVRKINMRGRQPLRVILDKKLRTPGTAKLLSVEGETLIFSCTDDHSKKSELENSGATVINIKTQDAEKFLNSVLTYLAQERKVNEIMLETGSTLAGSMLNAGLIDEIILYVSPVLLGSDAKALFKFPEIKEMTDRVQLQFKDIRMIGEDCRITAVIDQS